MQQEPPIDDPATDRDFASVQTAEERAERRAARRSLRARLTGGPLMQAIGRADTAAMRAIRGQARSRRATSLVRAYSHLGEHGAIWIAIGTGGALLDPVRRRDWVRGLAGVGAAYLANTTLKQIARRPRPDFPDLPPLIPTPGPLSFPSSHSASSAAAVIGYAPLLPAGPLVVAATTMAASRVFLGVHYPSDILAGAAIGTIVSTTIRRGR